MIARSTRRIVVTGSECTGKTTLAAQLASALDVPWIPEFARQYASSLGRPLGAHDVDAIARGQIALEDVAVASAGPIVVLDTDLVSTVVYAEHYYAACPTWVREAATERKGDLYLLLDIDVPWVPDGIRDQPHARAEVHARFDTLLRELQAPVVRVGGLGDARLAQALDTARRVLGALPATHRKR